MQSANVRANSRRWYHANKDTVLAKARLKSPRIAEYQRAYRAKHGPKLREVSRQWRLKNGDYHRESSRAYSSEHKGEISAQRKKERRALKQVILNAYGNACACCGESSFEFLTIDHINGDGADHRRRLGTKQSAKLYAELIADGFPSGFQVLCFNCNSALGFYGYCPHRPSETRPLNRCPRIVAAPEVQSPQVSLF